MGKAAGRVRPGRAETRVSEFADGDSLVIRIRWNVAARLDYVPLLKCQPLEITSASLSLVEADHNKRGSTVSLLKRSDDDYVTINPGEFVDMVFTLPEPPADGTRQMYQCRIEGNYKTLSDNGGGGDVTFEQNYPNPLNPETTFSFSLPRSMNVRLDIFNVLGQKVTTLVCEQLPPGAHVVTWNGKNAGGSAVGSGVYFAKLIAGEYTHTRKVMVVK